VLLGELYKSTDPEKAECHLQKAWSLARTESEKQEIRNKIERLA
jgi:RNA polymerase sigma-70 factor (ECF subfamily)